MIKNKTTKQIFNDLKVLRKTERVTLIQIIEHLEELNRRRGYALKGHSTMFKYLTRELGYSEAAAGRRISALKLVKRVPEAKKLIADGDLNLSTIPKVHSFLNDETSANQSQRDVLNLFKGKTASECDELLAERNIKPPKKDVKRSTGVDGYRLSINMKKETFQKMEKLKSITGKYKTDELLDYVFDIALRREETKKRSTRASKGSKNQRYFTAAVKKSVYIRSGGKCEYKNCDEERYLEYDHVLPAALGGTNEHSNCRVLCRAHNQLAAIEVFGQVKMDHYL
jgi:hypothetical protein